MGGPKIETGTTVFDIVIDKEYTYVVLLSL